MLVQALAEYAQTRLSDQLNDEAWEKRPVPYLVEVGADGSFLGVVERRAEEIRGKKAISVPQALKVPRSPVNRNMGLYPLLSVDDIKYVLGIGEWTRPDEQQNHAERHEAFVALIDEAAKNTGDAGLQACSCFYRSPEQVEKARVAMKDAKAGSLVALSASGPLVLRPAVQSYWRELYGKAFNQRLETGGMGECLISGHFGPIAPTHEKIKGLSSLGGQAAGVSLMSFDKPAFRSYGWEQNQNSPVSPDYAMAYVLALNDLLRPGNGHRRDIAGVGFIFWLKKTEDFSIFDLLDQPHLAQVEDLLKLDAKAAPDPNAFYMAGVSGNGGRLRVRYWIEEPLPLVKRNLADWFSGLRVVNPFVESPEPVRFWQLRDVIHREGEPPAHRVIALLRRAIEGRRQPLGQEMLAAALKPLRRAKAATPQRLGLVRLCINDLIFIQNKGDNEMTEELDPGQTNAAYLCGRLFAEYEGLQSTAFRAAGESEVNVSIADRYYGLASTYPAIAFPKIETLGKKHLRKLQRENRGAAVSIEQRIQELHILLEKAAGYAFPSMLSLQDQGRFALGFYHQKAHSMMQAKARKEEKERRGSNGEEN
ncbi:MAG TPA: type I-C CRISPR-associated protein Cas8c/Csd1 [Candidatus Angelobacter sp.]|nr:type I-C CRISPR-associated protein Cas8c/Csd1 [Candidatus Angelobacter sp.]